MWIIWVMKNFHMEDITLYIQKFLWKLVNLNVNLKPYEQNTV